jgi:formylglycine-generating enzyme required for sulfatase activity
MQIALAQSYLDKHSPELDGPMIGVGWSGAAAYCNWLSEQEGLAQDQWCYRPNEQGEYDRGMRIPADGLLRIGYWLTTEAEWEYARRAGTVTSRYPGPSIDLLGKSAWYLANSQDHAWPGGRLLPNDLGLFDTLGNVLERCHHAEQFYQERQGFYRPGRTPLSGEHVLNIDSVLYNRGGSYGVPPASVRAALRGYNPPTYRGFDVGFRLARTNR